MSQLQNDLDHTSEDDQQKRADRFSRQIAIWDLEGRAKAEIAQQIIDDMEIKLEYRSQMFLSIFIATL
jgi:hypothetical protein